MTFEEWFEKHSYTLLGNRMMASMDYLIKLGKPLFDDAQPQWQPIETAPLGEMVQVLWDDAYVSSAVLENNYGEMVWYEHGDSVLGYRPTHWMPIPTPPKGDNK